MISAMDYPQVGGPAYDVHVRDAKVVTDEAWAEAKKLLMPWVRRLLEDFFVSLIHIDVIKERQPELLEHKTKLEWLSAHYKNQTPEYLETGEGHIHPGKDELLTATKAALGQLGQDSVSFQKVILKEELPELLERYGLLEC